MSNKTFRGWVTIRVPARAALARSQQVALKAAYEAGNLPLSVQSSCAIALAMNDGLANGVDVDGKHYHLADDGTTPKSKFGATVDDHSVFASTVLVDENGINHTLRWPESSIPTEMVKTAIKHDTGKCEAAKTFHLNLAAADVDSRTPEQRSRKNATMDRTARNARAQTYRQERKQGIRKNAVGNRPCEPDLNRIKRERTDASR